MLGSALFAALHHGLAFAVVALLAAEIALVRQGMTPGLARNISRIDGLYGAGFGVLIAVGIARMVWFEKGAGYYLGSPAFWAKIALLACIGLISAAPTIRFLLWRRENRTDPGFVPQASEIAATRRWLIAEAALFPLVLIFAALLARGY